MLYPVLLPFRPLDVTSTLIVNHSTLCAVYFLLTSSAHPSARISCHSCSLLLLNLPTHLPPIHPSARSDLPLTPVSVGSTFSRHVQKKYLLVDKGRGGLQNSSQYVFE